LITAVLLLIVSALGKEAALDIHLHDTYFVISILHLIITPVFILVIAWFVYLLTEKILHSKKLTNVHLVFSIALSLTLMFLLFNYSFENDGLAGMPRRYYDKSSFSFFEILMMKMRNIVICFLLLIASQFLLLLNIILGLIKKYRNVNT
jgi:cytochrome c oxidase subunit 1